MKSSVNFQQPQDTPPSGCGESGYDEGHGMDDRGREIQFYAELPSLQTVRAVLPYTAIQLVVDGLSETKMVLS